MKSYLSVSTPLATAMLAAVFAASPALAVSESGMTVTRDAETGQLRAPSAAEMKALQAARKPSSSRAATAPVEVRYGDGTVGMTLGDDHMMYSVARVNAQGKVEPQVDGQQRGVQHHHQRRRLEEAVEDEADIAAHRRPAQRDHRLDDGADQHQPAGQRG